MELGRIILEGRHARLEPLAETHVEGLRAACAADAAIWDIYPYSMLGEAFDVYWRGAQDRIARGVAAPLAVIVDGAVAGVSSFMPDPVQRTTEIGGTYLRPEARGGAVNPQIKRMMLSHAFDQGARRVQFRVDAINLRSAAAMRKLGAHQDGLLRRDIVTWTGRVRDTLIFSILAEEWPEVRERLDGRLATFEV